jgi:hypothetical protein
MDDHQPRCCAPNGESTDRGVSDAEAAKLLLDSWKFRQSHAWSSLTRYFLAAVLVSGAPYIMKETLKHQLVKAVLLGFPIGTAVLLAFPVIGGFLALAAVWLYAAEYIRAQVFNNQFRGILKQHEYYPEPEIPPGRLMRILFDRKIGWTTVYVLSISTILLALINGVIVWLTLP